MKTNINIHTSFVSPATFRKFIEAGYLPIFVIRSIGNSELIGKYSGTAVHFKELSPSTELFRSKRDGLIDNEEFNKRYIIELSEINFQNIIERFKYLCELSGASGIILFGYGSDNKKCHRSVLADLLNQSGLLENKITELVI